MPFDGSGNFTRGDGTRTGTDVWQQAADASVAILAEDHDTHDQDLAAGLEACLNRNGENSPTTNIPWGGLKITGLGNGTASGDAVNKGQLDGKLSRDGSDSPTDHINWGGKRLTNLGNATSQGHAVPLRQLRDAAFVWGGTAGGTANAITLSLTPALEAYTAGMQMRFLASATNTGGVTINVDSLGEKAIQVRGGSALAAGMILSGDLVDVFYDGTAFRLLTAPVRAAEIAANAVTQAKIASGAVGTAELIDLNVNNAKLTNNAVTTAKITDANVTRAKLKTDTTTLTGSNNSAVDIVLPAGSLFPRIHTTTVVNLTTHSSSGGADAPGFGLSGSSSSTYDIRVRHIDN